MLTPILVFSIGSLIISALLLFGCKMKGKKESGQKSMLNEEKKVVEEKTVEVEKEVESKAESSDPGKVANASAKTAKRIKGRKDDEEVPDPSGKEPSYEENPPKTLILFPTDLKFGIINPEVHRCKLTNNLGVRQAIKLKCTDNEIYRVNPVHFFVGPRETFNFEVVREAGKPAKADKVVVVYSEAKSEDKIPADVFKKGTIYLKLELPIYAS